ncbi:iron chelate uptake ABC transporter family permease subunit [Actinosynnema sp. NPDC020468]|uniref:FecCD family ABC transporter permease n=1 Tax=Actinosynnema sp. NPDC020468 TaxID=3154488 RepID=UPI0033CCBDAB
MTRALRSPSGAFSVRVRPRALLVGVLLLLAVLVLGVLALTTGDFPASPADVVRVLFGDGPRGLELVVTRFRLPRLLVAVAVGAALGAAGSIFQSVSKNPLGSPDVIGFTTGSATGALVVLLVAKDSVIGVSGGAVLGGVVSALVVYALAYRRGVQGFRLILVGIGVSAVLAAVNAYLLSRASLKEAQSAQLWLVGSLNGRGWDHAVPVWVALAVLLPVVVALGRRMTLLEMGDETATARGVPVERTRVVLVMAGVALTAAATAAAGPIAFVALAAPQVAKRLVRGGGAGPLAAALTGAVLLVGADLAGQRLLPVPLPVGLSTGAVGGLYLVWLLGREWRGER